MKNIKISFDVDKNQNFYSWVNFTCDIIIISNIILQLSMVFIIFVRHSSWLFCHSRGGSFIMISQQLYGKRTYEERTTRVCRYFTCLICWFFPQNIQNALQTSKFYIFKKTVCTFFWSRMDTFFFKSIGTCECHL